MTQQPETSAENAPRIFLSWSGDVSRIAAEALKTLLSAVFHHDAWYSRTDIVGDSLFHPEIMAAARSSPALIALMTKQAQESKNVNLELGAFQVQGKPCFLVLLDEGMHEARTAHPYTGSRQTFSMEPASIQELMTNVASILRTSFDPKPHMDRFWTPFKAMVAAIAHARVSQKVPNESFCSAHFEVREHLHFDGSRPVTQDKSDLNYCVAKVKSSSFPACLERLIEVVRDAAAKASIRSPRVWPLLGEAEILLIFRDVSEDGTRMFLAEAEAAVLSVDSKNIFLSVNVAEEYSRSPAADGLPASKRSTKAFIMLQIDLAEEGRPSLVKKLHGITERHGVVERVSFGGRRPGSINGYIVLDLHMPCGMLSSLKDISKDLEGELRHVLKKSTYLAYDQSWPMEGM